MNIVLYKFNKRDNSTKRPGNGKTVSGRLNNSSSIMSPSISFTSNFHSYNYAYIGEFGRYYYISDITCLQGKNVQFDCKVDVLMSFQKSIYESTQYVERQEDISNCNLYIPDDQFNFMANDQLEIGSFGREMILNNTNFILTTVG